MARGDFPTFRFHFQGMREGWYVFRAATWPTSARDAYDAYEFTDGVKRWLLDNVDLTDCHAGNGNVAGVYPHLPSTFASGNGFCVMLHRLADVIRFEQRFITIGLDPTRIIAPG